MEDHTGCPGTGLHFRSCQGPSLPMPHSLTEGQATVCTGLQVLGIVVVSGAQMDTVVELSHLHSSLPLI